MIFIERLWRSPLDQRAMCDKERERKKPRSRAWGKELAHKDFKDAVEGRPASAYPEADQLRCKYCGAPKKKACALKTHEIYCPENPLRVKSEAPRRRRRGTRPPAPVGKEDLPPRRRPPPPPAPVASDVGGRDPAAGQAAGPPPLITEREAQLREALAASQAENKLLQRLLSFGSLH